MWKYFYELGMFNLGLYQKHAPRNRSRYQLRSFGTKNNVWWTRAMSRIVKGRMGWNNYKHLPRNGCLYLKCQKLLKLESEKNPDKNFKAVWLNKNSSKIMIFIWRFFLIVWEFYILYRQWICSHYLNAKRDIIFWEPGNVRNRLIFIWRK